MSTSSIAYHEPQTLGIGRTIEIFRKETKYEFLKLLRNRSFSLAVIGFPIMFYLLFGVSNRGTNGSGIHMARYLLGGYACFGLIGAALFGIGVGLAGERAMGWLEVKRASPMPPMAYLFAKSMGAIAFGLIIVTALTALAVTMGGVSLTAVELVKMYGISIVGSISFASMGFLLALLIPANAAPGIVNLIYLPMSFMSGLWMPIQYLPHWLQRIAPALPMYHLAQLMLHIFGYANNTSVVSHWVGLAGFTMVMLGTSWLVFNRAQQNA
ncbi:MAG TPA: ABC transporter permease [Edaphobacter sp.]|nr:ABC transporter permease [Edaphobacter sp.]